MGWNKKYNYSTSRKTILYAISSKKNILFFSYWKEIREKSAPYLRESNFKRKARRNKEEKNDQTDR